MTLNENILSHRLHAAHGDKHSLIHDVPLGKRYLVRIDVFGADHREQADRIVQRVNGGKELAEAAADYARLIQVENFDRNDIAVHRAYERLRAAIADAGAA